MRFPSALGLLSAFTLSSACTDVSLYGKVGQEPELADKVALTGVLCTDNPATRKFPVKILFVVDASAQMAEAAPNGEHVAAIEDALSTYLPILGVEVGIISYSSIATQLIRQMDGRVTTGYTRDGDMIELAKQALANPSGNGRDLKRALSLASAILTGDVLQSERGPLSRTKYVVVHIVSGSPLPQITGADCDGILLTNNESCEQAYLKKQVRDLRDFVLGEGAAEFNFHTIYVEQPSIEGSPCDPRMAGTCAAGLACVQTGARVDTGRCVQPCSPGPGALCDVLPGKTRCITVNLPDGTPLNHCARDETACFDDNDNDRMAPGPGQNDPDVIECTNGGYPYQCPFNTTCEFACESACRTDKLGVEMALSGNGRYERISLSDQVSLARLDLRSTQRLFVLKELMAFNRSAIAQGLELLPDSDADGLPDAEEDRLALNPLDADSDADYFNDKLEHILRVLGTDPVRTTTIADCEDPALDTDGDSLRDCEEKLLGSDKTLFDTDADGFPDHIEFRAGSNILYADTLDDVDLDGFNNGRELRAHTDLLSNDSKTKSELAYRSRITDLGPTSDQRNCYDIRISNITLVDTRDRGFGPGVNDIDVYFGQVPEGDLEAYGLYHVAQVRVQYFPPDRRVPDTPAIDLEEGDFVFFEQ